MSQMNDYVSNVIQKKPLVKVQKDKKCPHGAGGPSSSSLKILKFFQKNL